MCHIDPEKDVEMCLLSFRVKKRDTTSTEILHKKNFQACLEGGFIKLSVVFWFFFFCSVSARAFNPVRGTRTSETSGLCSCLTQLI